MPLTMDQIKFETDIPDIPSRAPVVEVQTLCLTEREDNLKRLAERMRLGETTRVATRHGVTLASKRGEAEFFAASGGLWTADVAALEMGENEMRDWEGLERDKDAGGNPIFTLGGRARARAEEIAREMIEVGGFDMQHAREPGLSMVQVAQFSQEGETLQEGAGEAMMSFGYALEGLPVLGAGAKTSIEMSPIKGEIAPVSAFHVWRAPQGSKTLDLGGTEAVLDAGLLRDPELELAAERDGQIIIEEMEFGLMALPAVVRQGALYPILRIAGRVELPKEHRFHFGSFVPVAPIEAYAKIGVASEHLRRH